MQATYNLPKSPMTVTAVLASLLLAFILGAAGGYVVKGAIGAPDAHQLTTAGRPAPASLANDHSSLYVQGGRPTFVYAPPPPSAYVQGGRPQIVYDEVGRRASA